MTARAPSSGGCPRRYAAVAVRCGLRPRLLVVPIEGVGSPRHHVLLAVTRGAARDDAAQGENLTEVVAVVDPALLGHTSLKSPSEVVALLDGYPMVRVGMA